MSEEKGAWVRVGVNLVKLESEGEREKIRMQSYVSNKSNRANRIHSGGGLSGKNIRVGK